MMYETDIPRCDKADKKQVTLNALKSDVLRRSRRISRECRAPNEGIRKSMCNNENINDNIGRWKIGR